MVKLDATLKGFNLVLQWQAKVVHVYTNLLCVYHWLTNTRVRMKAASDMLVCRRLLTLQLLIEEYGLVVYVNLTTSNKDLVDKFTHIPKRWLKMMKQEPPTCPAFMDQLITEHIRAIHQKSRHLRVQCTTYFVRRVYPIEFKATVTSAIQAC